jgi:hypothetical protein
LSGPGFAPGFWLAIRVTGPLTFGISFAGSLHNPAVGVEQQQVGGAARELSHQNGSFGIAQFVSAHKTKSNYPIGSVLFNLIQLRICQIFSEGERELRKRVALFFEVANPAPNQVNSRGGRVCAEEEIPRFPQSKIDGQRSVSKLKYFSGRAVDHQRCNLVDDFPD